VDLQLPDNLPHGALIHYVLSASTPDARIEILDARGTVIRRFTAGDKGADRLATKAGFHRIVWNLRGAGPIGAKADEGEERSLPGVKMPPGRYSVRLTAGSLVETQPLLVTGNPRAPGITQADYDAQHALATAVRDTITDINRVLADVRALRRAVIGSPSAAGIAARALEAALSKVEVAIVPVAVAGQVGVPAGLVGQYDALYSTLVGDGGYGAGSAEGRPTASRYQRKADLDRQWQALRMQLQAISASELKGFNDEARARGFPELRLSPA
jgi:hypothetical protein